MKKRIFALLVGMLFLIVGCAPKIQGEDLMKDVKQNAKPDVQLSEVNSIALTDFAVRLFQASVEEGKNTLISPLSVLSALAMTANGAKGETLSQMEAVLGMSTDKLNDYFSSYMKALPQGDKYKLNLANSIWFRDDERFTVNDDFLQINADYFDADIYKIPFENKAVKDINNWVKEKTDGMIPEILDEIKKDDIMYLVNALTFEAEWANIYTRDDVRRGTFTTEDGKKQEAEYMHGTEHIYLQDDHATGFVKYYKEGKYAFVALLPNESVSVEEYVKGLDGEYLNTLLTNGLNTSVVTTIPKFETESNLEMTDILREMGMKDAFTPSANFSGLGTTTREYILIDRVLHKTFISVAEKGTKAGAATMVAVADGTSAMLERKEVYLDRPFVYMLIDFESKVPFFIGTMMDLNK
ncbi:MAG: serpin family protein [Tyzzerella sp.]|nr:serpin family protein [Tyzzerella sp.]